MQRVVTIGYLGQADSGSGSGATTTDPANTGSGDGTGTGATTSGSDLATSTTTAETADTTADASDTGSAFELFLENLPSVLVWCGAAVALGYAAMSAFNRPATVRYADPRSTRRRSRHHARRASKR